MLNFEPDRWAESPCLYLVCSSLYIFQAIKSLQQPQRQTCFSGSGWGPNWVKQRLNIKFHLRENIDSAYANSHNSNIYLTQRIDGWGYRLSNKKDTKMSLFCFGFVCRPPFWRIYHFSCYPVGCIRNDHTECRWKHWAREYTFRFFCVTKANPLGTQLWGRVSQSCSG